MAASSNPVAPRSPGSASARDAGSHYVGMMRLQRDDASLECPCADCLNQVPPRTIASFSPSSPTAADQYVTKLHQESARPPAKQPPNEPDLEEATIPMEYPMQDLGNKTLYRLQKLPPRAWQRLDLPAGAAKLCQRAPPQAMVPLFSRSSCCEA